MTREKFIEMMKILDEDIEEEIRSIGIENAIWDLAAKCLMNGVCQECKKIDVLRIQCVCIYHNGKCEFDEG